MGIICKHHSLKTLALHNHNKLVHHQAVRQVGATKNVRAQMTGGNNRYNIGRSNNSNNSPLIIPGQGQQQQQQQLNNGNQRIILPGQQQAPGQQQSPRIIMPGQMKPPRGGDGLGVELEIDEKNLPPVIKQFRPPAGFMDEELQEDPTENIDIDIMLQRLLSRAGKWYQLAPFIPRLHTNGYDASILSELTGLYPPQQNKWVGSCHIYNSLKNTNEVSEDILEYFEGPDGPELLYELRYLSTQQRITCVNFIVEKQYDSNNCEILARAVKDYERRQDIAAGFSDSAADCLAFKYYRDALESREEDAIDKLIEKGVKIADTTSAKERLQAIRQISEEIEQAFEVKKALTILRLEAEELGYCPIPVLGPLGQVSTQNLQNAPKSVAEGAFGIFEIPPSTHDQQWVALPMWNSLLRSKHPAGISIPEISVNKMLRTIIGTNVFSSKQASAVQGPGLLVVDLVVSKTKEGGIKNMEEDFFLVQDSAGVLQLTPGILMQEENIDNIKGKVLFLCRPPKREVAASGSGNLEV